MWDESGRSSGRGSSTRCSLSRPKFFSPSRGSKAESSQEELWSERDLVGPIAAVTGMYDPLGTGAERGVHVNQEARVRAAPKLGGTNWTTSVSGQHFKERRFALWGFPFGADSFTCQDTEHAGLEKVNTERPNASASSSVSGRSLEGAAAAPIAEPRAGIGVSRMTSCVEFDVLPGA